MKQTMQNLSEFKISTPKRRSKLEKTLQEKADRIEQGIFAECLSENRISETIEFTFGWVEIEMRSHGTIEVTVCHSENGHESPMLEATIVGILPDWWSVQTKPRTGYERNRNFKTTCGATAGIGNNSSKWQEQ